MAVSAPNGHLTEIVIPGEPRSKKRPQFGQGRAYTAAETKAHEEMVATALRQAFPEPLPGNVLVEAVFYRSTRHRIDIDNLLKAILDAANKICFIDDQQVTEVRARLELDRDNPRSVVRVGSTTSTLIRGGKAIAICRGCGGHYATDNAPDLPDGYCTVRCGRESRSLGLCAICKAPLQRRGALLCQSCWLTKAKKKTPKATLEHTDQIRRGPRSRSSSRRGVSYRKDTAKWAAYAQWDGRRITLGSFATEAEAIAAVDQFEGKAA